MTTEPADTHPRIDWIVIGGPIEPWTQLGLVAQDNRIALAGTGIEVAGDGPPGMLGWAASGLADGVDDVDGVPTFASPTPPPTRVDHPLGARMLDHVVVNTDDLLRTCDAVSVAFGAPLKRVRELGAIRQGFHRVGPSRTDSLIVEVVERPDAPAGAALWGLVVIVDDLDGACASLGEVTGPPKDAVQPGRRIATVRREAGLGVPVALMSPEPRRDG
jgi:hypothetical protein